MGQVNMSEMQCNSDNCPALLRLDNKTGFCPKHWYQSDSRKKSQSARVTDGRHRWSTIWSAYRITEDDYDNLVTSQFGLCPLCSNFLPDVGHIDHDHNCCPGKKSCGNCIRGITCGPCNRKLGIIESIDLEVFLNYLGAN